MLAGVDTTSNALARTLHLLSEHPDVQEKLRREIHDAHEQYGTHVPYDEIMALPYMDAICRETLRLYVYHFVLAYSAAQTSADRYSPVNFVGRRYVEASHVSLRRR